jgi:hypothetical protein
MKWSDAQMTELKALCIKDVPNAELAKHYSVDVKEIYAVRSKLGLTIPKVRELQKKA